jgi:hypothetical protein
MFSAPVVLNVLITRAPRAARAISSVPEVVLPTLACQPGCLAIRRAAASRASVRMANRPGDQRPPRGRHPSVSVCR